MIKNMERKHYLLNIQETESQQFEPKKHFYLITQQYNTIPKSPKRDLMISENEKISFKPKEKDILKKEYSLKPRFEINKTLEEKIDQKITENIKNRKDIEVLFNDPEIQIFLNEDKDSDNKKDDKNHIL